MRAVKWTSKYFGESGVGTLSSGALRQSSGSDGTRTRGLQRNMPDKSEEQP